MERFDKLCQCQKTNTQHHHYIDSPRSDIHKITKLPAYTVTTCVTKSPTATSTSDIHKITKIPRLHCKLPPTHSLAL